MAKAPFANTFEDTNPGSAVGNLEDIERGFNTLTPEDTPFFSAATKVNCQARSKDWLVNELRKPKSEGYSEGSDVTEFTDPFANAARLSNDIQGFSNDFKVSEVQEAVSSAGPVDYATAEVNARIEIRRDLELALLSKQDKNLQTTVSTKYMMRGMANWIQSGGPSDVPAQYQTPASSIYNGTLDQFNEKTLKQLITSVYKQNGTVNNLTLLCGAALRDVISDFSRATELTSTQAAVRSLSYQGSMAQITNSVDFFKSDHGMVSLVNGNPLCMGEQQGFVINPRMYQVGRLVPFSARELPRNRGGRRGYIAGWYTLLCLNPLGHGLVDPQSSQLEKN
jgi:hypothetical protein